jgi:hypothetical protein
MSSPWCIDTGTTVKLSEVGLEIKQTRMLLSKFNDTLSNNFMEQSLCGEANSCLAIQQITNIL